MTAKTRLLCLAVSTEIIFYKAKHTTYGCQCIPAMYKELPDRSDFIRSTSFVTSMAPGALVQMFTYINLIFLVSSLALVHFTKGQW